jgi:hypothetical protein
MIKQLMAKYTGKYKDLMPAGYKFYSKNYRTYEFECTINDSMRIFQKGNDIEILDFYAKSGFIVNCFVKNREKLSEMYEDGHFSIRMNTKTGRIWHFNKNERHFTWGTERRMHDRLKKTGNRAAFDLYWKKWKTAHIPKKMVEEVLRLWDLGLIDLVEK